MKTVRSHRKALGLHMRSRSENVTYRGGRTAGSGRRAVGAPPSTLPALALAGLVAVLVLLPLASPAGAQQMQTFRPPAEPPAAEYIFDVSIAPEQRQVEARGTITLTNTTSQPIGTVALRWDRRPGTSLEVRLDGHLLEPLSAPADPVVLPLPEPVAPGARLQLELASSINGFIKPEDEPFYRFSGTTFPRLWWGERGVAEDYRVKITYPSGFALAASGRLDETSGYYEARGIELFGIYLGIGMHTATRDAAGVRITALYTDRGEAAARICLDVAADAVSFYRDWLGLYPHRFLFIVPWGAGVWGGFPWAPGIAAIHGEEAFDPDKHTEHFKWITAHEIGHQYWGWYVLDPDDPPWLWIGMGIYADHEYAQARLGSTWKHEQYLDRYLEGVRRLYDTTLEITPNREEAMSFDRNNYVIHAKGFAVIWALEGVLGREAFQDLYRRCLRHFAHRPMGLRDLWTYIEAETGQDLDWFFEQWARSDKYLLYEVTSTECHPEGGAFVSRILITRRGDMAMPIPVRIHFADGTTQEAIVNRLAKQTVLELASASELERVELDPERHFAMLTEPIPLSPELLDRRASRLSTWSPDLDEALDIYAGAVTLDLQSSAVWRKLGIVLARRQAEQALDCWQRYSALVETPADRFHAAAWLGLIEDTLGHREQALSHYRQALDAYDGTRTWPYSQYGFRISRAWVEQRLTEPLRWQDA